MKRTTNQTFRNLVILTLLAASGLAVRAEVKPNSLFSDGVVLQQGIGVPIWGTAKI
jgi:hypothetical protein